MWPVTVKELPMCTVVKSDKEGRDQLCAQWRSVVLAVMATVLSIVPVLIAIGRCSGVFAISAGLVFILFDIFLQLVDTVCRYCHVNYTRACGAERCRTCWVHMPTDRNHIPNNCAIGWVSWLQSETCGRDKGWIIHESCEAGRHRPSRY